MTIYAICIACGRYLDKDDSICRACGADNDPDFHGEEEIDLDEIPLDRLNSWSKVKHEIIEKYAAAYTTILQAQRWVKRYVYIDAFAGAGVAVDAQSEELIAAGALRALEVQPRFSEYHFIEENPDKVRILRRLTRNRPEAKVYLGDYRTILPGLLSRCEWKDFARGLCLLDPYGLSVDYDLLQQIASMKTIDIFFNFMLVAANRNALWKIDPARLSPTRKALVTRVWGHDQWPDELYDRQYDLLGAHRVKVSNERVIEAYRKRLREAGFTYVADPIPMKNSANSPVYYLFFCSPKAVASDIAEQIFARYR